MTTIQKVNISEKLSKIHDHWNPRVAGELNGQHIRLVKIIGDFPYHRHDEEDEMFQVIKGTLKLDLKDKIIDVFAGEFIIVPRGTLHRPIADEEVHLMMFVTNENVNTGNLRNDRTLESNSLERI